MNYRKFYFQKSYIIKVDVLPFLTVSSSLGLPIIYEFKEWKRLVQFLVGKPTLAKLNISKANNRWWIFAQKEKSEYL